MQRSPSSSQRPVKKVDHFFDENEDDDEFETFENDKDFAKMECSLNPKDQNYFDNMPEEENLGQAWGGIAFSLKGLKNCVFPLL